MVWSPLARSSLLLLVVCALAGFSGVLGAGKYQACQEKGGSDLASCPKGTVVVHNATELTSALAGSAPIILISQQDIESSGYVNFDATYNVNRSVTILGELVWAQQEGKAARFAWPVIHAAPKDDTPVFTFNAKGQTVSIHDVEVWNQRDTQAISGTPADVETTSQPAANSNDKTKSTTDSNTPTPNQGSPEKSNGGAAKAHERRDVAPKANPHAKGKPSAKEDTLPHVGPSFFVAQDTKVSFSNTWAVAWRNTVRCDGECFWLAGLVAGWQDVLVGSGKMFMWQPMISARKSGAIAAWSGARGGALAVNQAMIGGEGGADSPIANGTVAAARPGDSEARVAFLDSEYMDDSLDPKMWNSTGIEGDFVLGKTQFYHLGMFGVGFNESLVDWTMDSTNWLLQNKKGSILYYRDRASFFESDWPKQDPVADIGAEEWVEVDGECYWRTAKNVKYWADKKTPWTCPSASTGTTGSATTPAPAANKNHRRSHKSHSGSYAHTTKLTELSKDTRPLKNLHKHKGAHRRSLPLERRRAASRTTSHP